MSTVYPSPKILSRDEIKSLPVDDFIALALSLKRYDVDVDTAIVSNVRRGRKLKPSSRNGYAVVSISAGDNLFRKVLVHRIIAIKVWGVDAVRGKDVGHLRGKENGNHIGNLWLPTSAREHNLFDGAAERIAPYCFEAKKEWKPCARCGDPNGYFRGHHRTPDRMSGCRFGIDGMICRNCYCSLWRREQRQKRGGVHA